MFSKKPWRNVGNEIAALRRRERTKRNRAEKRIVRRQAKCEQMEVSITGENEDKMKPNWACAVEAAWRQEWA
jgi:hypothetical protein